MTVNLVATINVGNVWYAEHTVPYMRAYAARVNADFLEFRCFENRGEFPAYEGWLKLEALSFLAEHSRYGAMLMLDADQLVMPSCPNLFEEMDDRMAVVQDMGMPENDDRFRLWCERNHGWTPDGNTYFNAGMLCVPLVTAQQCVRCCRESFVDDLYQEQDYLNFVAQRHR
ncbi:MAG: glycosyltransferase family protein, partial [Pirellulaceae bacterium]